MANVMYNISKHNMEIGLFNWTDGLWYAALVDAGYAPSVSADTTVAAYSGHQVGSSINLASCASSAVGALTANSVTYTGISAALTVKAVVVYHDTGSATFLAFYFDTGTGFPLTTTGSNITVDWNGTAVNGQLMTL